MILTIMSWNIARREIGWDLINDISPDIALLQEFKPSELMEHEYYIYNEIGGTRKWGTGIVSKYPIEKLDIETNYKGCFSVGDIHISESQHLTAISMYGIIEDGYSAIGLHHMLSDLTLLLDGKLGKRDIILSGDFNASIQFDKYYKIGSLGSHRILFERIRNFHLTDCLEIYNTFPTQTYRHHQGNRPWQIDHMFITDRLKENVISCLVLENERVKTSSDHNPILMRLEI
jgi:exonuclease III